MIFRTPVVRAGLSLRLLRMCIRPVADAPACAAEVKEQDESRGKSVLLT